MSGFSSFFMSNYNNTTQSTVTKKPRGVIIFLAVILIVGFFLFYIAVSFFSGLDESWTVFWLRMALVVLSLVAIDRPVALGNENQKTLTRKIIQMAAIFVLVGSFVSVIVSSKDYLPIPDRLDPNLVLSVNGDKSKIKKFYDFTVHYLELPDHYWMIETDEKTIGEIADYFGLELGVPDHTIILKRTPAWWPKSLPPNAKVYRARSDWQRLQRVHLIFYMIWDPISHRAFANFRQ